MGYALLVSALFMFISALISVADGDSAMAPLLISCIITFTVGIFPFIFVRKTDAITLKDGYLIIVLSWLLSFLFGMLPYALWGGPFTLENAWFESVSGYTTTGATILGDIEALPRSLLFWRSSTHFIGGLGVVVFLLLILPNTSPIRLRLTNMELSSLSRGGYNSRTNKTVYIFAYVYLALTASAFVCYMLAGMSPFDAINHAFSVCAAGGFSTKNLSIAGFQSPLIEGITMLFMILATTHFGLLYLVFITRSFKPLGNPVFKFYIGALVLFSVFLGISLMTNGLCPNVGSAFWNGAFQVISIASTTGFATMDNSIWPMSANIFLMLMAVMCGCAGSTTGGIKSDRVLVLFKSIGRQIERIMHPSAVSGIRLGDTVLKGEEVAPHILYITLYFLLLAVSVLLTTAFGVAPNCALAGSLCSLSNVGPAIAEIGLFGNFDCIPLAGKLIFTFDMFLGRVEIYPVLAVVVMIFSKKSN